MKDINKREGCYIYEITQTEVCTEEDESIVMYGIRIYNSDPELSNLRGEQSRVDDISNDKEEVMRLCRLLREEGAYPPHLAEIVEDYLS